jgi:prevent-host-death family protein
MTMGMTMVTRGPMTRFVKASEFKAKCLALMDEVERTGEAVVITKRGKPVAELVPSRARRRNPLGIWADSVAIAGDVMAPIDVEWDALK